MHARIISDLPGRLRIRAGQDAFSRAQGYTLEQQMMRHPFISGCIANANNGSVLIHYRPEKRAQIFYLLDQLRIEDLEDGEPLDGDRRILTATFTRGIVRRTVMKYVASAILPLTAYKIYSVCRALPYFKEGLSSLCHRRLDVPVLDAASIGVAMLNQEFSTASNIMYFLDLSEQLEAYTTQRVKMDLVDSLAIHVDQVWRRTEDGEERIPYAALQAGDCVHVRTGNVIPIDGIVADGHGMVDEASMTGESRLSEKRVRSTCYAGTVLADGDLWITVREVGTKTRRHRIIEEIQQAEGQSQYANRAIRWAEKLVPYNFLATGLVYLLTRSPRKAMATLLVDYSCAIRLYSPIATLTAIREAAENSIAIKGGKYLEQLAEAKIVLFDKTGTLTKAQPCCKQVIVFDDAEEGQEAPPVSEEERRNREDECLRIAACIEEHFPHSVARAIVEAARERNLNHEELHGEVEYVVAHGIHSTLNGEAVCIGSHHFLFEDEKIPLTKEQKAVIESVHDRYTVLYMSIGKALRAIFLIEDPAREEAKEAIEKLRERGIEQVWMLTGDGPAMAHRIANEVGVDVVHAQVLPDQKSRWVAEAKKEGPVVMVGDGINDSPALAHADVSIAMKDAADIAREVSNVVLLDPDLRDLARLRDLAIAMNHRMRNGLLGIIGWNTFLLGMGVAGMLQPTTTAWMHNASTFAFAIDAARSYHVMRD